MEKTKTSPKSQVTLQNDHSFFIGATFRQAWKIFKKRWHVMYGVLLFEIVFFFAAAYLVQIINDNLPLGAPWPQIISGVLFYVALAILGMGVTKMMLKIGRDEEVHFINDVMEQVPNLFKYILAAMLYVLIVIGGLILLVIPGLIQALKFMFMPYLVIDKGMGPIEAKKMSAKMTQGVKWDLVGFYYPLVILMYSGLLGLIVGIFITIPVAILSMMVLYNKLLMRAEKIELKPSFF